MTRSRSRPRFRVKKTGSCPCVQEGKDAEIKDERILSPQEPRFLVQDLYNPNDEYVDLESYSEISSVAILGDPTIGALAAAETSGEGDQVEESIFLSGGTVSSVQPEDSEPTEGTSEVDENRQLNIAATVMSWLDNYGQARGCNLGSHGTSLIIQRDELSRRGSAGSIDMDDEAEVGSIQTRAAVVIANPINDDDGTREDETTLEAACSMIIKCHNDLQPLQATIYGNTWKKVQEVLSAWANLMSAVWTRSQEGRITRSELFTFVRLCENLESQALTISPIDASNFANPVVRNNLSRVQGFINLTLKWCKEIQVTGRIENVNHGEVTSWGDSQKQVFPTVIEQLRSAAKAVAKAVLENHAVNCKFPRYEIVLEDVVPTRTNSGWMFFGKVELKHLKTDLYESASSQIVVKSEDSALRVLFLSSIPKTVPCIDYGGVFHIVNRASSECSQFYRHATQDFLEANLTLSMPLLPDTYPKAFANTSQFGQYMMMELVVSHLLADQSLEPTVTAIDEILRSFSTLVSLVVQVLKKFVKSAHDEQSLALLEEHETSESKFKDITVPMATDANTLAFRTVRRFMSLGPLNFTSCSEIEDIDEGKSNLNAVHKCLERGINHLYETPRRNVFSFPHGIQTLFAISQLVTTDDFAKNATIDRPLRALLLDRLSGLKIANREARESFERVVGSVDKNIKSAERVIDRIMKKGVTLGVMVPGRASGVSFSHRHGRYILIRYKRNSYIRHQAKRLKQSYELRRHTRKYVVEPDCCGSNSGTRESANAEPMRETR